MGTIASDAEIRSRPRTRLDPAIVELGLERHVLELEVDGFTAVPPEVHGVDEATIDRMVEILLAEAHKMTGCPFSLTEGPTAELEFPPDGAALAGAPRSQFLIQRLCHIDRLFRDLAVNRVAVTLIRHLIGRRATRFSSHNAFIKWQGDWGYGPTLGLHCDQAANPLPWGARALTANTNWCLTDYTLEGGAFAYVPGSHRSGTHPVFPQAVERAVPAEHPKGTLLVFHGALWHGAFPRRVPGMRLSVANYYRHQSVTSQEELTLLFPRDLAADCTDPEEFATLAGFADRFPYRDQTEVVPRVAGG